MPIRQLSKREIDEIFGEGLILFSPHQVESKIEANQLDGILENKSLQFIQNLNSKSKT
jgi:hypothetical protein